MKTSIASLVLQPLAVAASIFDTILPTTAPSVTSDPWVCTTRTLEAFFDVPKPTGALLDALLDFGDDLMKGCEATFTDYNGLPVCEFPAHSKWCAFSSVAPATVQPEYTSYASAAHSFWAEHSSAAAQEAIYCPNRWWSAMMWFPAAPVWLNDTIAFAGCYAAAHATDLPEQTTTTAATTGAVPTTSAAPSTTKMP